MTGSQHDDASVHLVVVNHEEQYSIWPSDQPVPRGWTPAGYRGSREECLAHIETVWTDMRPLSLRRRIAAAKSGETR